MRILDNQEKFRYPSLVKCLQAGRWRELEQRAGRLLAPPTALDQRRIVLGREPEDGGHDEQPDRPDIGHRPSAIGDQHERGDELGDRGTDVADAEDAEGGALLFGRIPARDIGNADRERAAGEADAEGGDQRGEVVSVQVERRVAIDAATITVTKTMRPPYWSVQMPRKMGDSEPDRIGMPSPPISSTSWS